MIQLPTVTLIALATRDVDATARAMEYSCQGIVFGGKIIISLYIPYNSINLEWHHVDIFPTIDEWNKHVVYELWRYFNTEHCLLVHADGFVVNPHRWDPKWLSYDYVGSPWSHECAIAIQGGRDQPYSRVGNSVGLRSRKLCKLPSEVGMEWKRYNADSNEDTYISCHNWKAFEEHGCTKIPFEEAIYFGREEHFPENAHVEEPFLFHKHYGKNAQYPRF